MTTAALSHASIRDGECLVPTTAGYRRHGNLTLQCHNQLILNVPSRNFQNKSAEIVWEEWSSRCEKQWIHQTRPRTFNH